jgi:hypothetical protein
MTENQIIAAFQFWLLKNPQGGIFEIEGRKFKVTPNEL